LLPLGNDRIRTGADAAKTSKCELQVDTVGKSATMGVVALLQPEMAWVEIPAQLRLQC